MKGLIQVVSAEGADTAFAGRFRDAVDWLRARPAGAALELNGMNRLEKDPLGHRAPYAAALEIRGARAGETEIEALATDLVTRLGPTIQPAASCLLVGEDHAFVPSERAPVRYQYLMRRNDRFDHDAYLARYRDVHSQFGIKTPGILGYVQFYVELEASRRIAERAGLGFEEFDSVSELHLASPEAFLAEVARSTVPREATEDERVFVDRERSCAYCSDVLWQGSRATHVS